MQRKRKAKLTQNRHIHINAYIWTQAIPCPQQQQVTGILPGTGGRERGRGRGLAST
jgi:hypothetical protein